MTRMTPYEFDCLVDMFITCKEYVEEEWRAYEIHDKRHTNEKRRYDLRCMYEEAKKLGVVRDLILNSKVIYEDDDDIEIDDDYMAVAYKDPMKFVRDRAREAGMEDYLEELELDARASGRKEAEDGTKAI